MANTLEKVGKMALLVWDENGVLNVSQRPQVAATQHIPTWCTFNYSYLTLTEVTLHYAPVVVVEVDLSALLAVLRAVEIHTSGQLSLLCSNDNGGARLMIAARSPVTLSEARDLRPTQPGILVHEIPVTVLKRERNSIPREPSIPPPALTVQLISGLATLRNRLLKLKEHPTDALTLGLTQGGNLTLTLERPLLRLTMQFPVRIIGAGNEERLRGRDNILCISLDHLVRVLSYQINVPGATTVWALVPHRMLIVSATVEALDAPRMIINDQLDEDPDEAKIEESQCVSLTFFIPALFETP